LSVGQSAAFGNTVGLRRATFATVPPEIRAEARRILASSAADKITGA
jgi:hypothetical protein